jgi:hypothetical protein
VTFLRGNSFQALFRQRISARELKTVDTCATPLPSKSESVVRRAGAPGDRSTVEGAWPDRDGSLLGPGQVAVNYPCITEACFAQDFRFS